MSRATQATPAGRAYLDLQRLARSQGKNASELMTMYVVERWLARLAASPFRDDFVLKGGMLLASLGARRPTADADALARNMAADEETVLRRVVEIASTKMGEDGVMFEVGGARAHRIREESLYGGTRVRMDAQLSTAKVRFSLDVNFGDPVTPGPQLVELPSLRPGLDPICVLGYPIATVLAEKLATAIALGAANTRVRDYADIWMLTADRSFDRETVRQALTATSAFRAIPLELLSTAAGSIADSRAGAYAAFRRRLGPDGVRLPDSFGQVVREVVAFADPLVSGEPSAPTVWMPARRQWTLVTDEQT